MTWESFGTSDDKTLLGEVRAAARKPLEQHMSRLKDSFVTNHHPWHTYGGLPARPESPPGHMSDSSCYVVVDGGLRAFQRLSQPV